jgi:hypothetical protein
MALELKTLALTEGFILHVVHVAGTRMIEQGTDGLSRAELQLGSLLDKEANRVPLHRDPTTRSPAVLEWVASWLGEKPKMCAPKDWFYEGHMPGTRVWALPPAAALEALEELSMARLKRAEEVSAIVLVPALLRPEWFRRFVRTVDLYFAVPPGTPFWPSNMHEPLIVGFSLPFLRFEPWEWKRVPFMVGLARTLSGLHKTDYIRAGDILRKFWRARTRATSLPESVVREVLHAPSWNRFLGLSGEGRRRRRNDSAGRGEKFPGSKTRGPLDVPF